MKHSDGWGRCLEGTFPAKRDLPWGSSLGSQLCSLAGEAVVAWQQCGDDSPGDSAGPFRCHFKQMSNTVNFNA